MLVQLHVRLVPIQLRASILASQNNLTNKKSRIILDYRKWQKLEATSPSPEMERTQSGTEFCSGGTGSALEVNAPVNQITLTLLNFGFASYWLLPQYLSFGVTLTGHTHYLCREGVEWKNLVVRPLCGERTGLAILRALNGNPELILLSLFPDYIDLFGGRFIRYFVPPSAFITSLPNGRGGWG